METHLEFIALAKVSPCILRPLVGLAQQDPPRIILVHETPQMFQVLVCLWQVLTVGAFALEKIGHCIGAKSIYPQI